MNLPKYFSGKIPAYVLFFTVVIPLNAPAQAFRDSLSQDIETVRITKLLLKNSETLSVGGSQLLSHDAGKFLNSVPEISAFFDCVLWISMESI